MYLCSMEHLTALILYLHELLTKVYSYVLCCPVLGAEVRDRVCYFLSMGKSSLSFIIVGFQDGYCGAPRFKTLLN